jgi:hypothetical protein
MFLAAACSTASSSPPETGLGLQQPTLVIQEADGNRLQVPDFQTLQDSVPFAIVRPHDLPFGMAPNLVMVTFPPNSVDAQVRQRHVRVLMSFVSPDRGGGFQLTESMRWAGGYANTGVDISLRGGTGNDAIVAEGQACEVNFSISTPTGGLLTEHHVLDIANSIVEQCA